MCGIFALFNYSKSNLSQEEIEHEFKKGYRRGPEFSKLELHEDLEFVQGFHRLAINGLNEHSNQPLNIDDMSLICNGEIYNYVYLYQLMGVTPKTGSDCEVILHLYKKYGIEQTLRMLDGVFSFVLRDKDYVYVARDPLGVRPLYYMSCEGLLSVKTIGFGSELKMLCDIANKTSQKVLQFPPGTFCGIHYSSHNSWNIQYMKKYYTHSFSYSYLEPEHNVYYIEKCLDTIKNTLENAVRKRYLTTERPIACLLSGGLDSSLITALVCKMHKEAGRHPRTIETYSIGLPDSEDVKYAKKVAQHLGTTHHEIIVSEQEMIDAIPEVIRAIESYDVTTVRASIGNYLVAKYISQNSDAKVIFNGDGSDELCGGYLYMHHCPDSIEFDKETIRLLNDIYLFDVLRSDKSISSNGLEPRTPFLDKEFVNYYLSIPIDLRNHNVKDEIEKYLIRCAFSKGDDAFREGNVLPYEILWRRKEAFSDGVSNHGRSLFQIIQDYIDANFMQDDKECSKRDKERLYYWTIFNKEYPNHGHLLPYYWMPKYIHSNDPSARTLASYKK
jgi:asparagine synthase (glutamine-hydrolysing)